MDFRKSLELTLKAQIEDINRVCKGNDLGIEYAVEFNQRERTLVNTETEAKKKQYYGVLLFSVMEGDQPILLWRQEYVFHNLTDKRNDFLWKEKLTMAFLYESIGVFAAITRQRVGGVPKEIYDFKTDTYQIANENSSSEGSGS